MIISNPDLAIITETYFNFDSKSQKDYSICNEFIHTSINVQHFLTYSTPTIGYLVFYITKGQGMVYSEYELKGLKKNDLCIIDLSEPFYISSNDWEYIATHISGDSVKAIINDFYENKLVSIEDSFYIERQFYLINHFMKKKDVIMVSSSVQKLLSDIKKNACFKEENENYTTPINQAVNYIEENFKEKVTIDELANHVGFSKFYFIRLFQSKTNKTPYKYLMDVRLDYSKFLLKISNLSIKEIAVSSGFTSEMNFYQNFIKDEGISPSRYRKL